MVNRLEILPRPGGHIHQYDWRITVGGTRWTAEARRNGGDPAWAKLAVAGEREEASASARLFQTSSMRAITHTVQTVGRKTIANVVRERARW